MISSAERLLARLAAVDLAHPRLDRQRVEHAWREHCRQLRLEPLALRWVKDAEEALDALASGKGCRGSWWSAWKSAVAEALAELLEFAEMPTLAHAYRRHGAEALAVGEFVGLPWGWLHFVPRWSAIRTRALSAAWRAAEEETGERDMAGAVVAGWDAPEAAALIALGSGPAGEAAGRRWLAIWRPCIDAFEAGQWLFDVREEDAFAVPRPALRIVGERLHCETGPAVFWPGGARYYFWRGVRVPARVIEDPAGLHADEILRERDVAVRRAMIDRVGSERLVRAHGTPLGAWSSHGRLWRVELDGDEPLVAVEVFDPSTARRHFLRVPRTTETAREGVAWSFDPRPAEYEPALES